MLQIKSKGKSITLILLLIISFITLPISAQAQEVNKTVNMSPEALVEFIEEGGVIKNEKVSVTKATTLEKNVILANNSSKTIKETEIYVVDKKLDNNSFERTIVADFPVSTKANSGSVTNYKDGRAKIACTLNYKTLQFHGATCFAGASFGGRVVSQSSSVTVKSLHGRYVESGAYYNAQGYQSVMGAHEIDVTFDVSKRYSNQFKNVSTGRYFLTSSASTGVSADFTIIYTIGDSVPYPLTVTASAPSSV